MSTRSPRGHTMAYDDCDFLQLLCGVVRSSNLSAARAFIHTARIRRARIRAARIRITQPGLH